MGKGNKTRKREVKKPKQDKKLKQANQAAKGGSAGAMTGGQKYLAGGGRTRRHSARLLRQRQ